ncbi:hypothetical protein [Mitsuaria sp. 7]|uniref:hypothetical protein n=1 Tax=Mitsuaria sp. 7 TaxID=1658665 RepID=UPI0008353D65|nr:hypothetical protein [Mitsuaria sp. 7]
MPNANAGALRDILSRWPASMATLVLNEVECRLRLIAELRGKLDVVGVDEVHELQPLVARGLWMFGPEFESAEFTANAGMTRVIRKFLKDPTAVGSRNRPDFVVLPDSSIGLYACPSYDAVHEVNGIKHLALIELKTTGTEIGDTERSQVAKYVKELRNHGCFKAHTKIDCYVLGEGIQRGEEEFWNAGPQTTITLMRYDILLEKAERRLLNLYEKIKHAPFLMDQAELSEDDERPHPSAMDNIEAPWPH